MFYRNSCYNANRVNTDQTPLNLHCLPMISRLKWAKAFSFDIHPHRVVSNFNYQQSLFPGETLKVEECLRFHLLSSKHDKDFSVYCLWHTCGSYEAIFGIVWIYAEREQNSIRFRIGLVSRMLFSGCVLILKALSKIVANDILGPVVQSVVSLTSSLRVISLIILVDSIYNILIFFAEKMWVAFALTFFQQKISAYLRITRCKF